MQPETMVTVLRVLGRTRSVARPGWYCWTCKVSQKSVREPSDHRALPSAERNAAAAGHCGFRLVTDAAALVRTGGALVVVGALSQNTGGDEQVRASALMPRREGGEGGGDRI